MNREPRDWVWLFAVASALISLVLAVGSIVAIIILTV